MSVHMGDDMVVVQCWRCNDEVVVRLIAIWGATRVRVGRVSDLSLLYVLNSMLPKNCTECYAERYFLIYLPGHEITSHMQPFR